MSSALISPHTAPTRPLLYNLLPWLRPVLLLEPYANASKGCPQAFLDAGVVETLSPGSGEGGQPSAAQGELIGLLRRWEDWIALQRGAGHLDSIKAGVSPTPPPRETVRSLIEAIRSPSAREGRAAPPPEQTPELVMHLAHIRGLLAQDVEGVYSRVEQGQQKLRHSLGLDLEEDEGQELAEAGMAGTPPLDYRLMEETDIPPVMAAWSRLVPLEKARGAVLACDKEPAAILGERLKALSQKEPAPRSGAGASGVEPFYISWPPKVCSLKLPDLSGLEPQALLELLDGLAAQGNLAEMRDGLAGLMARAASRPFGSALAAELQPECRNLEKLAAGALPGSARQVGLGIMLLPGLDLAGALDLMRNQPVQINQGSSLPLLCLELN